MGKLYSILEKLDNWETIFSTKDVSMSMNLRNAVMRISVKGRSSDLSLIDQFSLFASLKKILESQISTYRGFRSHENDSLEKKLLTISSCDGKMYIEVEETNQVKTKQKKNC
jgi:hypothetical protein